MNDQTPELEPTDTGDLSRRAFTELRSRLLEVERRNTHLGATLEALQLENEGNRARLIEMRTSLSWRVTRPLRRIRRLLSRSIR